MLATIFWCVHHDRVLGLCQKWFATCNDTVHRDALCRAPLIEWLNGLRGTLPEIPKPCTEVMVLCSSSIWVAGYFSAEKVQTHATHLSLCNLSQCQCTDLYNYVQILYVLCTQQFICIYFLYIPSTVSVTPLFHLQNEHFAIQFFLKSITMRVTPLIARHTLWMRFHYISSI